MQGRGRECAYVYQVGNRGGIKSYNCHSGKYGATHKRRTDKRQENRLEGKEAPEPLPRIAPVKELRTPTPVRKNSKERESPTDKEKGMRKN